MLLTNISEKRGIKRADHDAQHEDGYFWIGWKWFEFHAKQRMEAFKFFLTIVGAALTISSGFLQTKFPVVSTAGSVIALAVCLIFWQIDRRSLQLIEIGERVLEQRWAERGELTDLNPVTRSALRSADGSVAMRSPKTGRSGKAFAL